MSSDMELHTVASLLRRGQSLDQFSTGLTLLAALIGLGQWLVGSIDPWLLLLSFGVFVLGMQEKYLAFRVAFDADLFQIVADAGKPLTERTQALDTALANLGLQPVERGGRSWPERSHGSMRLLRRQAWVVAIQALLTVSFVLASPWLVFSGLGV
ncbi:hypothetical protein HU762_23860 [Pseudomonas sp. SWRI92]|uniref:Uncharacterized protein n=1 Tax=Pseudomonas marvdashtae TaxID=2745500 RepID=A0A923JS35_9PSED|nr:MULTISPECIES: hypothetical protein [Pseudomonas]MBC3376981.1 hypothetical protein [Pseudomonas sp. SWRI92]MBV4550047.1 hypothetical protein [Pseudomonas marvdashtae]